MSRRRTLSALFLSCCLPVLVHAQALLPAASEFQLNTYTTGDQGVPAGAVAIAPTGDFVAVWDNSYEIVGQRFDNTGTKVGAEFVVDAPATTLPTSPAVGIGSAGDFIVVWQAEPAENIDRDVFAQRFDNAGTPIGSVFQVNVYTTSAQRSPAVTAIPGGFVIVWASAGQDGADYGVFGRRFDAAGQPAGTEFLVNTTTPGAQDVPRLAADAAGNFVVVWQGDTGSGTGGIFGQRFSSTGVRQGTEFQSNELSTAIPLAPAVAADGLGNFVVAWGSYPQPALNSFEIPPTDVLARRYDSSGIPQGTSFRLNTYRKGDQDAPAVAADGAGNFVVVWNSYTYGNAYSNGRRSQDGSFSGVFGQRFDPSGLPLGPEFRVNTSTLGNQDALGITTNASGDFVVVWRSQGQDGSGYGVFAQRYSTAVCTLVNKPRIVISNLGGVAGNEKIVFTGKLRFPPNLPLPVDPSARGAQLRIEDLGSGASAVVDLSTSTTPIPPGMTGSGCGPLDGWRVNRTRTRFTYKNSSGAIDPPACTAGSANGLRQLSIVDGRNRTGQISFRASVKNTVLDAPVGPLRGAIVLGATAAAENDGECGTHAFMVFHCAYNQRHTTLRCKN